MTLDEALDILKTIDWNSHATFSAEQKEAFAVLGTAGWAGDIQPDDPRFQAFPENHREDIIDIVRVMATKRIVQ